MGFPSTWLLILFWGRRLSDITLSGCLSRQPVSLSGKFIHAQEPGSLPLITPGALLHMGRFLQGGLFPLLRGKLCLAPGGRAPVPAACSCPLSQWTCLTWRLCGFNPDCSLSLLSFVLLWIFFRLKWFALLSDCCHFQCLIFSVVVPKRTAPSYPDAGISG